MVIDSHNGLRPPSSRRLVAPAVPRKLSKAGAMSPRGKVREAILRTMRIAIDARWIFREISGIGAYTRELTGHLARVDRENQYLLLFCDDTVRKRTIAELGGSLPANFKTELLPYGVFSLRSQLLLPALLRQRGVDVYHSTNYMIPFRAFPRNRRGRIKCVTTVHDVIPLVFPHGAPRSRKSRVFPLFVRVMLETGRRSHAIITDSGATAADVLKHMRIPAGSRDRIHTIYPGVGQQFRPDAGRAAVAETRCRNVLYVGRCDPYKNVTALIRAFDIVRRQLPFPARLLVAGPPDPRYPEGPNLAADLGLGDDIYWTGYLAQEDLVKTYREADVLVHPSRYEGFGLQVLEAMACGVPVISSNGGSLPEVVGDAAIVLDPDDVPGYARAIRDVLTNNDLARSLSQKGIERAKQFSWERTASQTLSLYEHVAGSGSHD